MDIKKKYQEYFYDTPTHIMSHYLISAMLIILFHSFYVCLFQRLHLSEDVAGATFMAAGSSAPELFTSVIGKICCCLTFVLLKLLILMAT